MREHTYSVRATEGAWQENKQATALKEMTVNCSSLVEEKVVVIVGGLQAATGFVSLLASCLVIALVVLFKKWQFFTQRLVLYLAISVVFQSIASMIIIAYYDGENSDSHMHFCQFSGFVNQIASWMVLNAVASITVYVFVGAVFSKQTDRFEVVYLFFIFVFPLLLNWLPFIDAAYGNSGVWCWIRNRDDNCNIILFGQVLQFILWYIPLYLILTILIFLYVIILVKIHYFDRHRWTGNNYKHADEQHQIKMMSREIRSLLRYPLIYFLANLFPLILRIYAPFVDHKNDPNKVLPWWILTAIFFPIQGGFIALAFTLDPDTRKRLRWVQIKSAAKELCQRNGKDYISEYPAKHIISDTENSSILYKTNYHDIDNHVSDKD
jgi:hypothetical protein